MTLAERARTAAFVATVRGTKFVAPGSALKTISASASYAGGVTRSRAPEPMTHSRKAMSIPSHARLNATNHSPGDMLLLFEPHGHGTTP